MCRRHACARSSLLLPGTLTPRHRDFPAVMDCTLRQPKTSTITSSFSHKFLFLGVFFFNHRDKNETRTGHTSYLSQNEQDSVSRQVSRLGGVRTAHSTPCELPEVRAAAHSGLHLHHLLCSGGAWEDRSLHLSHPAGLCAVGTMSWAGEYSSDYSRSS